MGLWMVWFAVMMVSLGNRGEEEKKTNSHMLLIRSDCIGEHSWTHQNQMQTIYLLLYIARTALFTHESPAKGLQGFTGR